MGTDEMGKGNGFTLIELIVVIAIIGILMAFVLPSISGIMWHSRKSVAQNCIKQLANAYLMYRESKGDFVKSDGTSVTNMVDFALVLAQEGFLNDPNCYVFSSDALAQSVNKVKKDTIIHANKTATGCWTSEGQDNSFSVRVIIDIPDSCQPNTTPIAYTRGLQTDGTWSDSGVFGKKGGFIAFLDGKVKWFDSVANKLIKADKTAMTNNIDQTLPSGCRILEKGGNSGSHLTT